MTSFSFGTLHVRCHWNLWHLLERNSGYPQRDLDDESHCQHSRVWVMGWVVWQKMPGDVYAFGEAGAKMTSLYFTQSSAD